MSEICDDQSSEILTTRIRECMVDAIQTNMDVNYHGLYSESRMKCVHLPILETIILSVLIESDKMIRRQGRLFTLTAGAMGAGKGHHKAKLVQQGVLDMRTMADIDPDKIKTALPENQQYILENPLTAFSRLHKESAYLAEVAMWMCFCLDLNILVDGTLKDHAWYTSLFKKVKIKYSHYWIEIIHVTANRETILKRVAQRAQQTHRHIPSDILEDSIVRTKISIAILADCKFVDAIQVVENE